MIALTALSRFDMLYGESIVIDGQHAYVLTWNTLGALNIIDIRDQSHLTQIGTYDGLTVASRNAFIDGLGGLSILGDYAYLAGIEGLQIVDISNPSAPLIRFHNNFGSERGTTPLSDDISVPGSGDAWIASPGKVSHYDLSNPDLPVKIGEFLLAPYSTNSTDRIYSADHIYAHESTLYLTNYFAGVERYDSNGGLLGVIHTSGHVNDIALDHQYAYVATDSGLEIHLIAANFPLISQHDEGRYIWGINADDIVLAATFSGRYAVVSDLSSNVYFIDISDPFAPRTVGYIESNVLDVAVSGDYAYILTSLGIETVYLPFLDTIRPPRALNASLITEERTALVITIDSFNFRDRVEDVLSTVKITTLEDKGMLKLNGVDVVLNQEISASDIRAGNLIYIPQIDSTDEVTFGNFRFQVSDGNEYSLESYNFMIVVTPSLLSGPSLAASFRSTGSPESVVVRGNYAYLASGTTGGFQIVDISDPNVPTLVGSISGDFVWRHDVALSGNYAFVANRFQGVETIDISNPSAPRIVSTQGPALSADVSTWWGANSVAVDGGRIYLANYGQGVVALPTGTPESFDSSNQISIDTTGDAEDVAVVDGYIYVANQHNGSLEIFHSSGGSRIGIYQAPESVEGIAISGDYAYLAIGGYGLYIIDISNPAAPSFVGRCDTPGWSYDVVVEGNYAYVADGASGLQIIDFALPDSPLIAGSYVTAGVATGVSVSGNSAYIAAGIGGLQIINISGFRSPDNAVSYSDVFQRIDDNNIYNGGEGNDILSSGIGNDTLTGGTGLDFFVFDTEIGTTSIGTVANSVQTGISQLYVAIFNRASEGEGNSYWQDKGSAASIANEMLATTDARGYFGSSLDSNQAFIEHIYLNTLNKTSTQDPGGIAYWTGLLNNGLTRGEVVASLVDAIGNYAPGAALYNANDAATVTAYSQFANRVAVSDYMAQSVFNTPNNYAISTSFNGTLNVTDDTSTKLNAANTIVMTLTSTGANNIKTITDFTTGDDYILLENTIFTSLTSVGALATGNFYASTAGIAHDSDDYIIYNTSTGILSYDADANGSGASIQLALMGIDTHPVLINTDFRVV